MLSIKDVPEVPGMTGACQSGTEAEMSAGATAEHRRPLTHMIGGGNPPAKRETQGAFHEMRESQLTVVLVDSKYGGRGCQRREESESSLA